MMSAARARWDELVVQAAALGFTVELVDYCESVDSPGLLGAGLGVCIYAKRAIRIRRALRDNDRCFVLEHELDHARGVVAGADRAYHERLDAGFHEHHDERHSAIARYLYPRAA